MSYKTNNIVIVGGGSAGWMTAATLIKAFPNKKITVIESKNIPTVGVGESTVFEFADWLHFLDIDKKDFISFTNASFKFGIGFTNFLEEKSDTFYYPFGSPNLNDTVLGLDDWVYLKSIDQSISNKDYVDYYYPQSKCLDTNKVVLEYNENLYPFRPDRDVVYQIDASRFGLWLAEKYAIPKGVTRIYDTITKINGDEHGIKSVITETGLEIFADLFIDCSGFKSILLGSFMKEKFIDTKDILPNNKAWFGPVQYTDKEKELQTFTNCTGLKNGWVWNTPLWSRIGTGYVYSDEFIDDDGALQEFKNHLDSKDMIIYDPDRSKKMEFRKIEIKNGYYERPWVKNVVGIGLAHGFLEPLESTGLFLIHSTLLKLVNALERENVTSWDINGFNKVVIEMFKESFDFVALHYALSKRDDSDYWRSITSKEYPERFYNLVPRYFGYNISCIPIGMDYRPFNFAFTKIDSFKNNKNLKKAIVMSQLIRQNKKQEWDNIINNSVSHYQYLKENYYNEI